MFVARFDFTAKYPQSISFAANDQFLVLRKENDHWYYVFHEDGRLGSIPTNYVEESNVIKSPAEVVSIIDAALGAISPEDIFEKDVILNYLGRLRDGTLKGFGKNKLPRFPLRPNARPQGQHYLPERKKFPPPPLPCKRTPGTAYLMLDKLRSTTRTSYLRCVISFEKMLNVLANSDPQLATLSKELINEILDNNPTVRRAVYTRTDDWKALQSHVTNLETRAKDQQESSWPLAEDDSSVISDLDSLVDLLCNMDPDMVCRCVTEDDFPLALSYLYQRERRSIVRRFYLLIVVAICHIQPRIWNVFLDSCIPMEIIREIGSSDLAELDFILDLRMLTILFTKANSLPLSIQNELFESFFDAVFTRVSKFMSVEKFSTNNATQSAGDNGDSASRASPLLLDTFLQFVCAANRHFCLSSTSLTPVLNTMLANHVATKDLIERLLFIFNRDADPLSLDGVSFVRKMRGTLGESFDLSSDHYNGSLLYQDGNGQSDNGLFDRSRHFSSTGQYVDNENGEVSGEDCPKIPSQHRPSLADVILQNAPDTPVNSARKLLSDIFSTRETASLVYRNDVKVVIDVIIRQICDLPATSPNLPEFLFCMDKVIRNTDCMSPPYRLDDLLEALKGVEYSAANSNRASDFTTIRSLRLTNDLLTLLKAMSS
ncbi:unnamed protein product [Rodentolepis nana]|uniref:SH3 domain-containing protein n=1 Tax=Rodentolepis nana TaxID=102285 RepID=A0A0R3TMZ3_RODNA|nr:unnamed protein product [Rodentolepis nana]